LSDSLLLLLQVGHEKDLLTYLSDKFFTGDGSKPNPSSLPMEEGDLPREDHGGKPPMRPDRKHDVHRKGGKRVRKVGEAWDFESERDVFQSRDKLPRSLSQRGGKPRSPLPTEFHPSQPIPPDSDGVTGSEGGAGESNSPSGAGVKRTHPDVSGTSVSGRRISSSSSSTRSPESVESVESVGASPDASRIREDPTLVASLMSEEDSGGVAVAGLVGEMSQLRSELDQMRKNVTDMRKFFKQSVRAEMKKRQRAANAIQRVFRGHLVRKKMGISTLSSSLNTSFRHAVLIHRRLRLVRLEDVHVASSSAMSIRRARLEGNSNLAKAQALIRGVLVRSRFVRFLEQKNAVVKIQKVWRGYRCRRACGREGSWLELQHEHDRQRKQREWDATVKDLHERIAKEARQRALQERALRYLWEEMKGVHHEMEALSGREQNRAARVIQRAWKEHRHRVANQRRIKEYPLPLGSQRRIESLEKEVHFLGEQLESLLALFGDQMDVDAPEVENVDGKDCLGDKEEEEERRNPLHRS
jgi:hypothetical protein